jgi:MFS family permease
MSFTSGPLRRNRDLWVSVVARAVSLLGDEAAVIALTLRLHDSGGGAGMVAALLVAGMLPLVVFAGIAGRLVDRYDSRPLLVWSGLAQAAVCTVLALVHGGPTILALVVVLGAGQAVNGATWQALLAGIVEPGQLSAAMGLSQAARTIAGVAAPAVGGILAGRFGTRVPLLLDAATFVAITAAALLIRTHRPARVAAPDERMRSGFAIVRDDPVLAVLLTMLGAFIVLGAMVNVIEVFLVRDTLHSSATWYGVVGGTWALGMLAGSLLGARWSTPPALVRVILVGAGVLSAALAGYGFAPSVGWLLPMALTGGAANGLLNLSTGAMTMLRAPYEARGRVSAAVNGVASAAMIGAYVLGGVLANVATPRQLFIASGALGLLAPLAVGRMLLRAASPTQVPAAATPG